MILTTIFIVSFYFPYRFVWSLTRKEILPWQQTEAFSDFFVCKIHNCIFLLRGWMVIVVLFKIIMDNLSLQGQENRMRHVLREKVGF